MGVVLHFTWRHKGFTDGREIELMRLVGSGTFEGWFRSCFEAVKSLWALTMFARGQYSSTFKSRYVDFLPVPSQKNGSTADCSQEVDTGEFCTTYVGSQHCCNIRTSSHAYQGRAPVL